jgi:hypothetical protein
LNPNCAVLLGAFVVDDVFVLVVLVVVFTEWMDLWSETLVVVVVRIVVVLVVVLVVVSG